MKKVIVTGASGFIGGALTKRLLEKGITVYGVGTDENKLTVFREYGDFVPITADFSRYDMLNKLIPVTGFDAFFHFAWGGYGKDTNNIHIQTKNVVAAQLAAAEAGAMECEKFIMACSSHEYQVNENKNGVGVCSIYGASKTAAKIYAKVISHNSGMKYNGVIFTNVFGVGDTSSRSANSFIRRLLRGEDLDLINGEHLYDWTYIDDVVSGIISAAERGLDGKDYYVGSKSLRPFRDIVTDVRDILSPSSGLNFGAFNDTSYIDYSKINISELYNDTGYTAEADFRESILKTAEWVRYLDREV